MSYLDEAAEMLRAARDVNEARAEAVKEMQGLTAAEDMRRQVNDRRMELAAAFTRLAAIEHGLAPAFGVPESQEGEQ
jgi:hypothetical protein